MIRNIFYLLILLSPVGFIKAQPTVFSPNYPLLIKQNGKFGYINREGEIIIHVQYENADLFGEGVAPVQIKNKWGFIDTNGKLVIQPKYNNAYGFINGVTEVNLNKKKYLINSLGNVILKENNRKKYMWSNERIGLVKNGNKYYYIDTLGKKTIKKEFQYATLFQNGIAIVKYKNKLSIINKQGDILLSTDYNFIYESYNNLFIVQDNKYDYGVIDIKGNIIIPIIYERLDDFSEGYMSYQLESNHLYGIIDSAGNIKTPPIYNIFRKFSNGYAAVKKGDKWTYIDKNMDTISAFIFDEAFPFSCERAFVKVGDKFGVINTKGEFVFPPIFDDFNLNRFNYGIAMVYTGGDEYDFFYTPEKNVKMGFIDINGNYIWEPTN